jgi:hypothetical protein
MADFEFSSSVDDVTQNLMRLHSYALGTRRERDFHFDRVYNAEHQVYYKSNEGSIFAPVKWCGARDNSIGRYNDRKRKISDYYQRAIRRIGFRPVLQGAESYDAIYREFLAYCYGFDFKNSSA